MVTTNNSTHRRDDEDNNNNNNPVNSHNTTNTNHTIPNNNNISDSHHNHTNSEEDDSIKIPDIPAINNSILVNSTPEKHPLNHDDDDDDNNSINHEESLPQIEDDIDDDVDELNVAEEEEDEEEGRSDKGVEDKQEEEEEPDAKRVKLSNDDDGDSPDNNNTNNENENDDNGSNVDRCPIPDGFLRACIDRPGSRSSEEWSCEILFPAKEDGNELKNVNILKQVGKRTEKFSKHGRKHVSIYFCDEQYPSSDGFNSGAFAKLFKDIQQASLTQGIQLIRNGRYRWMGKQAMKICCTRALCYRPTPNRRISSLEKTSSPTTPSSAFLDATKFPVQTRKSSTKRAFSLDKKCKFFFLIYFDDKGFFVVPGSGNSTHCNHPKKIEEDIDEEKKRKRLNNLVDTIPYSNWLPSFTLSSLSTTKYGLPSKTPDIHFHCPDGTIIHAHKLILTAASEHFQSLFQDKDKTWEKEHPNNIWKVDFSSESMQMFILYMYTGELTPKLLEKHPYTILPVVYEFKLTKIVTAIEEILMKNIDLKTIKQVLISAAKHELSALKLYCFQFIRYNMANVLTDKSFITLVTEHVDIWDDMTQFLIT